ncbi:MAG: bifunctional riboflavin kinase/FMN adenylyltransferase [Alphaproteobacteria bacterium]|nr:bifunctional riboflavin kinase/FMN adenylyltransferase [Alphaproteobacteria bacterium]|tara:strand:- start:19118 stop:20035 length:918 start_codon:yes stop_codon:yes gene_type:complete
MKQLTALSDITQTEQGAVIIIGNFDGVHRGHVALLRAARDIAQANNVPCGVLTFEPHPRRLFRADEPPGRITPCTIKAARLDAAGMDFVLSIPFDWEFASQSSDYFIQEILQNTLKATHVVVGYNFRFGQLRQGQPSDIRDAGIHVTIIDELQQDGGDALSSSAVRQLLRHGDIEKANHILGWDWEIQGQVVKGDQRGRELGYPTANLKLGETIHPAYGIYAAQVCVQGEDEWHKSAVNIGIRPMFEVPVAQVEAHILDFDRDIYDKILRVRLVKRLRGEAKFDSLEALIEQIEKDCEQTRSVLN